METTFRAKRDWWLALIIWGGAVLLLGSASGALLHGSSLTALAMAGVAVLMLWILYGTAYAVTPTHLQIRSGPCRWSIARASITRISRTNDPISSPATSLDRLEIFYAEGRKRILVSPADAEGFCAALHVQLEPAPPTD